MKNLKEVTLGSQDSTPSDVVCLPKGQIHIGNLVVQEFGENVAVECASLIDTQIAINIEKGFDNEFLDRVVTFHTQADVIVFAANHCGWDKKQGKITYSAH